MALIQKDPFSPTNDVTPRTHCTRTAGKPFLLYRIAVASVEGTVRLLEGRAIFQGQLVFACQFPLVNLMSSPSIDDVIIISILIYS